MTTRTSSATTKTRAASPPPDRSPPSDRAIRASLDALRGRRVAVAMSGGVDSAVAALLLVEAGADVVGLSLRLHDPDPDHPLAPRACCPPDDLQDARRVAEALSIPFYVIDGRDAFHESVVRPFVGAYLEGRTPNPCVGCNSFVKLSKLARRAQLLGCAALATGHYARLDAEGHLFTGADPEKDQSYFLFGTAPEVLAKLLFPVGGMTKREVRERALASGLPVAHKLESQEVCFVGGSGAGKFVMRQPEAQGDHGGAILDESGNEVGRHPGVMGFTVGQRKGIGLGGARSALHVLSIDAAERTITVGPAESLLKRGLHASRVCWPSGAPQDPVRARVRIRYRAAGELALVTPLGNAEQAERAASEASGDGRAGFARPGPKVRVDFDAPVRSVAPGQAAVFYAGEEVIGGGWIDGAIE